MMRARERHLHLAAPTEAERGGWGGAEPTPSPPPSLGCRESLPRGKCIDIAIAMVPVAKRHTCDVLADPLLADGLLRECNLLTAGC